MSQDLQPTLRDATLADAQQILDLRRDPRLRGMQYEPLGNETARGLFSLLHPGPAIPNDGWKIATILVNDRFAGHITQAYSTRWNGLTTLLLGWDLIPELWGRGIMLRALQPLIDQRCDANPDLQLVACCFASNRRCLRVIEKLGFHHSRLWLSERISHFTRTWGTQRVVKHCLAAEAWRERRRATT